jgi:hypothetical protein
MSELLNAAFNQEWEEVMVRRPLEFGWFSQRI